MFQTWKLLFQNWLEIAVAAFVFTTYFILNHFFLVICLFFFFFFACLNVNLKTTSLFDIFRFDNKTICPRLFLKWVGWSWRGEEEGMSLGAFSRLLPWKKLPIHITPFSSLLTHSNVIFLCVFFEKFYLLYQGLI